MSRKSIVVMLAVIFLFSLFINTASAEDYYGKNAPIEYSIYGKIATENSSESKTGFKISISGSSYTTGSNGKFQLKDLDDTKYKVTISKKGYQTCTFTTLVGYLSTITMWKDGTHKNKSYPSIGVEQPSWKASNGGTLELNGFAGWDLTNAYYSEIDFISYKALNQDLIDGLGDIDYSTLLKKSAELSAPKFIIWCSKTNW